MCHNLFFQTKLKVDSYSLNFEIQRSGLYKDTKKQVYNKIIQCLKYAKMRQKFTFCDIMHINCAKVNTICDKIGIS